MRIRWRGFELPTRVVCEPGSLTSSYGKFIAEPFERGYGNTIGNSLRRVLISSLQGTAVTSLKIKGVDHEFTAIKGVVEDVTQVVLNFKELLVKMHTDVPQTLVLEKSGKGPVTAGDITETDQCEVVNKDLVLATLADDVTLSIEFTVETGRGYVTAEENAQREDQPIGVIPIDAIFSPVRRVRYATENTRVGQMTNYDRLIVEIWTDGTLSPEMAMVEAATILRKHLNPFVKYFDIGEELVHGAAHAGELEAPAAQEDEEAKEKLAMPVSVLDPSSRAANCLELAGVRTIGDLVSRSEQEMLKIKNFGRTSLREIKRKLQDMGLDFADGSAAEAEKEDEGS